MKLIGLTGGIGSGKSTVAALFKTLGIPVYTSDERGKELMNTDPELRASIVGLFGNEAYAAEGALNNKWLASQVFSDTAKLDQLNALVHPAVAEDVAAWTRLPAHQAAPYLIKESAILLEENLADHLDGLILVIASPATRIARVMKRDKVSQQHVEQRMQNQWPDAKKIPLADFIIYNDNDRSLMEQVMDIDKVIRFEM